MATPWDVDDTQVQPQPTSGAAAPWDTDDTVDAAAADQEGDGIIGGTISSVAQGLTLGFGDRLESAARAAFTSATTDQSFDDAYDEAYAVERAETERFREEHPAWAIGGEITGAVAPTVLAGILSAGSGGAGVMGSTLARLGATTLGKGAARAGATIAANPMKAAGLGSAIYGAGESEGDMLSAKQGVDAIKSAAIGLVTMGVMKRAGKAVNNSLVKRALKKANTPATREGLETAKQAMYNQVDNSGLRFSDKAIQRMMTDAKKAVNSLSQMPGEKKGALAFIDKIPTDDLAGKNPTISAVDGISKLMYPQFKSQGIDKRFANTIYKTIEKHLKDLTPADVRFHPISGRTGATSNRAASRTGVSKQQAEEAFRNLKLGRSVHKAILKHDRIDKLLKSVDKHLTEGGKGRRGALIRQRLQTLVDNHTEKGSGLFTKKEIKEIEAVIAGDSMQKLFRMAGRAAPSSARDSVLTGLMAASGNPLAVGAGAGRAGSSAARGASNRATERGAQLLRHQFAGQPMPDFGASRQLLAPPAVSASAALGGLMSQE